MARGRFWLMVLWLLMPSAVLAYTVALVTFQWDTFTGTPLVLGDNEMSGPIALPFAFNFLNGDPFLRPYASIHVSSNGFITFLDGQPDGCTGQPPPCSGQNLPSATGPNGVIAGYWEDLNPQAGGTISYGTIGTAPSRRFVVQFDNVPHAPSGNPVSFQIKLFEASNEIEIHCKTCTSDGGLHTQGIEGDLRYDGTTVAACYTTNPALGLYVYGYQCRAGTCSGGSNAGDACTFNSQCPGGTCTTTATGERNAANFSLTNNAVRFTPPSNRTAIAPVTLPGPGNVIAVHYDFRVDADLGIGNNPPEFKLIYVPTRVFGTGSSDTYLLNSFFYTDGDRYTDPLCGTTYGFPPDVLTTVPQASFRLQIPDYITKGFTGAKTDQPASFPRTTSTGAIDGIAAAFGLESQFDVAGMNGSYELRRGSLITDKTGWHLVAVNCDAQGHCACQDGGLDPANPTHAFRQWDTTITLGWATYTTHAALPDDAASAVEPLETLAFLTEYFFTNGQFRVYAWNPQVETDTAPTTWQPLTRWQVTDHDGSTRYFGFRPSTYAGHCVLEVSTDPAEQTAYLFGASGFSTTQLDLTTCAATPTVTTGAATSVGDTVAMLNGIANANGASGTTWLEYGTAPCTGANCTVTGTMALSGTTDAALAAPITGLAPSTTYHFRIVAQNAAGTVAGADHAFTTLATSPNVAKILYGVAGDPAPHARDYTDATNAFGGTATTATGDVALQMVVRPSPATGEWVAAYADANGLLHVLCFDGIVWHNEWTATIGGTGTTRRFDVAYETSSGDAMVLYSGNVVLTNELRYRTKPGTSACGAASWSSETLLDPVRTSGTIEWVKLAWDRRASSNLLTAIWADDNSDLSAMLWSGTAWGDEPATPLETNLEVVNGAQDVEDFDTKFESLSGDVMVVWGTNVAGDVNGVRYATCTGGTASCTWSGVIVAPGFADDATHLDLSANPSTDEMVFASIGKRRSDLQAGYWSGSAWTATPNLDTTAHTPTARTRFVATGWLTAGAVTRSVVVYYDASANNVGWVLGNAGTFTVQTDFVPTPTFGTQKQYDIQMDPFGANHLMLTVGDGNSDLFAKRLVLNTNGTGTWTNADGGAALETHLASTIYKTFAFAYGR